MRGVGGIPHQRVQVPEVCDQTLCLGDADAGGGVGYLAVEVGCFDCVAVDYADGSDTGSG